MPLRMKSSLLALLFAGFIVTAASAQDRKQWSVVGGGPDGTRYSALDQINRDNVHKLKQIWRFDSGDEYEGSEIQCNPIIVDGVLYATTPRLRVSRSMRPPANCYGILTRVVASRSKANSAIADSFSGRMGKIAVSSWGRKLALFARCPERDSLRRDLALTGALICG